MLRRNVRLLLRLPALLLKDNVLAACPSADSPYFSGLARKLRVAAVAHLVRAHHSFPDNAVLCIPHGMLPPEHVRWVGRARWESAPDCHRLRVALQGVLADRHVVPVSAMFLAE